MNQGWISTIETPPTQDKVLICTNNTITTGFWIGRGVVQITDSNDAEWKKDTELINGERYLISGWYEVSVATESLNRIKTDVKYWKKEPKLP